MKKVLIISGAIALGATAITAGVVIIKNRIKINKIANQIREEKIRELKEETELIRQAFPPLN